ncbi:unnamed protein product [Ambrosiozyma monospora]|uniref:Unnamed protein product n=1 Tax=Ambrosiozyma monospora TaxID=43982 RepID=A0ACB5U2E3_AMBMO|nr:unnamed protein product [Ambrosiozyma monospora]
MKIFEFGCYGLDFDSHSSSRLTENNTKFLKLVTSLTCTTNHLKDLLIMDVLKSSRLHKLNVILPIMSNEFENIMEDNAGYTGANFNTMDDLRELNDVIDDLISWAHSTNPITDVESLKNNRNKKQKQPIVTLELDEYLFNEPIIPIERLANLNRNNDFELRLTSQPESHLSLDVISRFINAGITNPLFLDVPLDAENFERSLALINDAFGLKRLYLQIGDTDLDEEAGTHDINIVNPSVEYISIDWEKDSPFDLNLHQIHSLKELHFKECTL